MEKSKLNLDISIDDNRWNEEISDIESVAKETMYAVFEYIGKRYEFDMLKLNKILNINLVLSDDNNVWQLNKQYRGMDKPTNVLTFANMDNDDFASENEYFEDIELGDIIIAYETMQKEAKIKNISLLWHFMHLFIHGLLHILGFDHQDDEEAEEMEQIETDILESLGVDNPYQE